MKMVSVIYTHRHIENLIEKTVSRNKSILLLGPRQTGKTTMIKRIEHDLYISLLVHSVRIRYEKNPSLIIDEMIELKERKNKKLVIIIDEVQKVPDLMDSVQYLIDNQVANFILTGSSARKLTRSSKINLLPGRVVNLKLAPFLYSEKPQKNIKDILLFGSLPGIVNTKKSEDRERDLQSYVETYLEEEIRAEAVTRNVGQFAGFLELASMEAGKLVSFRGIANEIGVSHITISSYYRILEDCLIIEKVEPLTFSLTRKKLIKSPKYLFFDLGIRRLCANEGTRLTNERFGELLEQYVGIELVRLSRIKNNFTVNYWNEPGGPEVDWIISTKGKKYIPVEVKWSEKPGSKDARNLRTFLNEYDNYNKAYIVCRTPRAFKIDTDITAIPWFELDKIVGQSLTQMY